MNEVMEFPDREHFRKWLEANSLSSEGVWLLFGKSGGPKTVKAGEALEEALCLAGLMGRCRVSTIKPIKSIFLCAERTASGRRKIRS